MSLCFVNICFLFEARLRNTCHTCRTKNKTLYIWFARARTNKRVHVYSSDFRVHNLHQHIWIEHAQMSFAQYAIFNTLPMLLTDRIFYTLVAYAVCFSGLALMTLSRGGYKNILISVWLFLYIGIFFLTFIETSILRWFQLVYIALLWKHIKSVWILQINRWLLLSNIYVFLLKTVWLQTSKKHLFFVDLYYVIDWIFSRQIEMK